ncbi:MAG: hypothetical protein ACYDHP_10055 [Ferrimicrobium sp.]
MRAREIEQRRNLLENKVEAIRDQTSLPPDDELLLLRYGGWGKLPCSAQERMLLSAWIRLKARENGDTFALVNARPEGRKPEELQASQLYQFPTGEAAEHVQQLVGVLWDLIPYCEDSDARVEILSGLWPQKGHFQERVWTEMIALAAELAGSTKILSGLDVTILPEWLTKSIETTDDKSSTESVATWVAKKMAISKINKDYELLAAVFLNEKIRSFYDAFGRPGIKRLAESSRPAVALVVTTDFRNFKHGESDLQRTRELMTRTEELVDYLLDQGDLSEKHLLGGPFSACIEDLKGMILSATALERFCLSKSREYEERCELVGLPCDEETILALGKIWDEIFSGMPTLIELVNNHLYPNRYGCTVEDGLWPLPRRHRVGTKFVEDDEAQLTEDVLARVFSVGCEALSKGYVDPELLRAWLALWLGALRPKESRVHKSDLVPFAGGYLQVIAREFGKSGRREAYWPSSGLTALRLEPKHFAQQLPKKGPSPTVIAEQAWRLARKAWEEHRNSHPEEHLPDIPDRLAYISRKAVADIIRWNGKSPLVVTKVLGHETETSDTTYTQISRSEFADLHQGLSVRLSALVSGELDASP